MAKLTIYTDRGPRSGLARTQLVNLGIDFDEVNVEENSSAVEFLESKGRDRAHFPLPQYYVGESVAWENGFKDVAPLSEGDITTRVGELNAG